MDKTEAQGSKSGLAGAMEWLDKRFPATETFEYHVEVLRAQNFNFWYYFGFLAMFVLVNQLLTGVWLTMNYVPSSDGAFASVEYIMRDVEYGWLMRYLHSTGASFLCRGLSTHVSSLTVWLLPRPSRVAVDNRHVYFYRAHGRRLFWLPASLGQHVLLGRSGHCVLVRRDPIHRPRFDGVDSWRFPDVRNDPKPLLCASRCSPATGALRFDLCPPGGASPCGF